MPEGDVLPDGRGREHEEGKRFKRELSATGVVCLVFATIGFFSQGLEGAFNFAWTAFIVSVLLLIALAARCSVIGSTVIVGGCFGAIGLIAGGITGALRLVDPDYVASIKPRRTAYLLRGEANDFADIDTGTRPEVTEGSGPLADALRTRLLAASDPRLRGTGGGGETGKESLIGQPAQGIAPHRVTAADGTTIDATPVVVEANSLLTSQDPGYDTRLQPRERRRAAAQAQVRNIATNLDPERLGYSSEADRGSPIVGPDGLALRNVYERGGPAAQAYRDSPAGPG